MGDEQYMRLAIEKAREGISAGQSPFGSCVVKEGQVVACAHNAVWAHTDSTAHAEVEVIREACRTLGTIDLSECTLYSTCEPCPMCFSACHWAKIGRVVFGARIEDAQRAGFSELTLSDAQIKQLGGSPVELTPDVLREECADLFRLWASRPGARAY